MPVAPGAKEISQVFGPQGSPFRPHSESRQSRAPVPSFLKIPASLGQPAHHLQPTSQPATPQTSHPRNTLGALTPLTGACADQARASSQPEGRRLQHSGHRLGNAWLPCHREESHLALLPKGKQGKQRCNLYRVSVSNPNFRFVSRFRTLPFTSGAFVPLRPIPASAAAGAAALQVRGLGVSLRAARGVAVGPGGSCLAVPWDPHCRRPRRAGGLRVRAPGRLCPAVPPRPPALARGSRGQPPCHPAPSPRGLSRAPVGFVSPNFILPLGCEHLCPLLSLRTPRSSWT